MPAARAASSREAPSSTSARASIRREAAVSRPRLASRRSSTAPSSFRVIATVMAPPPIGYTADQPRQAPRGSGRDDASAIRAVGITLPLQYPLHAHRLVGLAARRQVPELRQLGRDLPQGPGLPRLRALAGQPLRLADHLFLHGLPALAPSRLGPLPLPGVPQLL